MQLLPCQPTSQTWFMSTSKACGQFAQKVLIGPTTITRAGVNEVHCKLIHDKSLDSHLVQPLQVAQYFLIPPAHLLKKLNTNKTTSNVLYIKLHHIFFFSKLGHTWPHPSIFRVRFITSRRIVTWCDVSSSSASRSLRFAKLTAAHSPKGLRMDGKCLVNVPCAQTTQALVVQFANPSTVSEQNIPSTAPKAFEDTTRGCSGDHFATRSQWIQCPGCKYLRSTPVWWNHAWWMGMMGEDWVKGQWPLKPAN